MPRPAGAAIQLLALVNGNTTRATPAVPRIVRNANQEPGFWRMRRTLDASRTTANEAPITQFRSLAKALASRGAAVAGTVLILGLSNPRVPRFIQGFKLAISCMRAKARRTCGIVMEPPTISATFNASMTSSRFQPSSLQRTR